MPGKGIIMGMILQGRYPYTPAGKASEASFMSSQLQSSSWEVYFLYSSCNKHESVTTA